MAKELKNTIRINNEEELYNINAVRADYVAHTLTINSVGLGGTELSNPVEFDGAESKEISIVPSIGGKFTGPVRVPAASTVVKNAAGQDVSNVRADGTFVDEAVLNYSDIKNVLLKDLSKTSVSYSWSGDHVDADTVDNIINGISIIKGNKDEDAQSFAKYNYDAYEAYTKAIEDKQPTSNIPVWFAAYLFICQETDNIYFGMCDSSTANRLATKASSADQLKTDKTIITNLNSTEAKKYTGEYNIEPGIKGVLPITNGGTGATTAAAASKNIIEKQDITPGTIKIKTDDNNSSSTYKHWIYGKYGIDLDNSDIIGINALFFNDSSDTYSECINFANTANNDPEQATWDRLYAEDGKLYFDPNRKIKDSHSATRKEVYHSGGPTIPVAKGGTGQTDLANVTVGQSNKVKVNYYSSASAAVATKYTNITISPNAPSGGSDGDIWIKI